MLSENQKKTFFRKRHAGGRSIAARVIDYIGLRLIFAAACWLYFRHIIPSRTAAGWVTAIALIAFMIVLRLWRDHSFKKFMKKDIARMRDEMRMERLISMPYRDFLSLLEKTINVDPGVQLHGLQKASPVTEDDILAVYHAGCETKPMHICATAPFSSEAAALSRRLPVKVKLTGAAELLDTCREKMPIGDSQLEARIEDALKERKERRHHLQARAFLGQSTKKYLLAAAVLLAVSFLTDYVIYYRMLASLCMLLAATTFFINRGTGNSASS